MTRSPPVANPDRFPHFQLKDGSTGYVIQNHLYVKTTTDGAAYGGWTSLGGPFVGAPAAAGLGDRLYVLARWATNELWARRTDP